MNPGKLGHNNSIARFLSFNTSEVRVNMTECATDRIR